MAFFGRGKNKIQNCYTLKDMYARYISKVDKGSPYDIPYSLYKDISVSYYKKLVEHIFNSSLGLKLPFNLGTIQIVKKKVFAKSQSKLPTSIDWENSVKYGKQLFHLNEHSGGFKYLFMWDKHSSTLRNIHKYRFVPTRANKRRLAKYIKGNIRDYLDKTKWNGL